MGQGQIALPVDNPTEKWYQNVHNWFRSKSDEEAPLLAGAGAGTNSQRYNYKRIAVAITLTTGAIAFVAFGICQYNHRATPRLPSRPLTAQEELFLTLPEADRIHENLRVYTSEAHLAGTESDYAQAVWTKDRFEEYGIEAELSTYYPLLNYPIHRSLALISGPEELRYEASLREDPVEEDETSLNPDAVPTFHGYSKNGTAKGRVIYANYGTLKDFQFLVDQGVEVQGTIALMRYGGSFRGLKLRAAEKFGCVGALIYSDPIDDGALNKEGFPFMHDAKPYPEGPWRSESSAQRGSVQYLSLLAGDPLTPGYAATKDAPRIKREDSPAMTQIPSLPLSFRDALPLLKATQGHGVIREEDWKGGLDSIDYYSGPTLGEVELVNHVDDKITPIWNVIGRINGTDEADKAVIIGNHRDAWVYGAVDPSSGSSVLLEIARSFGELLKTGWKPRRTIIFGSWDAEEYGLVGSTEWVEDNREWLDKEGAVYVNMDTAVSGVHFEASASPSLNPLLYEITKHVTDPRTNLNVYDAWSNITTEGKGGKPVVGKLGSGSDFTAFLDHLGITSVDVSFHGDYGVYHSNYDSFHWMEKFGDPTFEYHAAMARIAGSLVLRLADERVLPLYPTDYAAELIKYTADIEKYAGKTFSELHGALKRMVRRSNRFENTLGRLEKKLAKYSDLKDSELPEDLAAQVATVNEQLVRFERGFLDPKGIQSRPWFKHVVYAPSLWEGYSSQTFAAIAEAVDENDDKQVDYAAHRAAKFIKKASKSLKSHDSHH
ncbi:Zn-dependent exopeptidase [Hesseltinella vesiculosa]|uniref:Zn-dependent exopeptidase n=1 Tax=Hesseltinella vesiculosa TaxID=101127 RepID=A0A1X2GGB2_9FUNG|nr:Zn-dependent exopeptidase [Hesseltinella vesiculosa]